MLHFATEDELESWLRARGVDLSRWGREAAKTVGDLWAEIRKGESVMQEKPPLRSVQAVRVVVRRGNTVLIEARQAFDGGRRRERNRPPSEKMHPGESYTDAALHCLREELSVDDRDVVLHEHTYRRRVWEGNPASYPGLNTRYTFHIIDATVQGLPREDFCTTEQAIGPGEPIGVHYWEWRKSILRRKL